MRTVLLLCAALCAAAPAVAQTASPPDDPAQIRQQLERIRPKDFPQRPLELVVAYPAGGGMDLTARILAKYLEKYIERPVVVANRAGAAGLIGHAHLATEAEPDGHTIGVVASNFWQDSMFRAEGKWSYESMQPIAFVNYDPVTWIVSTKGPFKDKTLQDVVAAARANPGAVRVAASTSTSTAFVVEQVQAITGTTFLPVLYQGGRQALTDLLGGHIDLSYGYLGEYRSQMQAGQIQPIAVTSTERVPALPDTPTFNEVLDTQDIVWDAFRFVVVPKGTPPERVRWLEAAFNAALADPGLAAEYDKLGATVDRRLDSAEKVAAEVKRRADKERAYFLKTGRLK